MDLCLTVGSHFADPHLIFRSGLQNKIHAEKFAPIAADFDVDYLRGKIRDKSAARSDTCELNYCEMQSCTNTF